MKYETKTVAQAGGVCPDWESIKAMGLPRLPTWKSPYGGFFETLGALIADGHLSEFVEHDDRFYVQHDGTVVVHTVWNTLAGAQSWLDFIDGNPYFVSKEIIERPDLVTP